MSGEQERQRRLKGRERGVSQPARTDLPGSQPSIITVVLRSCAVAAGEMIGRRIRYADADPVVGSYEEGTEDLRLYPLPTSVYAHYEEWVWVGDVSTLTVPLMAYRERGRWIAVIPLKGLGSLLPDDEPVNEGGFG